MYNLYRGNNPPVSNVEDLLGRNDVFEELNYHIQNRRSVAVMGVEGVGKSSLLNCFFNLKYRQEMAAEQRLLIRVTDFPVDRDANGIYQYLAEGVVSAVNALDQEKTMETYHTLRAKCAAKMEECHDKASRFQQVCEVIQEYDYNIMLVIDGFERFVSSPHVKMEHHDLMNTLIAKNLSFVVATNFDFNHDSLPAMVSGSFLLMKFAGNEIKLKGLSEGNCAQFLREGGFTDREVHQLYILSGGIPFLLRRAAEHTLACKENGPFSWEQVRQDTYADVSPLLARWCRLLSANQVEVMNYLAQQGKGSFAFENATWNAAAKALMDRGLLANPIEVGTGRSIPGQYKFSTPLLKQYCREHTLSAETSREQASPADPKAPNWDKELDLIVESNQTEPVLILYRKLAQSLGLPMPIDFQEELSDELLQEFQLQRSALSRYDQSVQDFICNGIRVERTFSNVDMLDFSPSYISFAKAIEVHLNLTLLPVMKLISPNELIGSGYSQRLCDVDHLMLGQISFVLNRYYSGTGMRFVAEAGQYCSRNLGGFPETWWTKLRDNLGNIKMSRNHLPHIGYFTSADGRALLQMLFSGEKSFFSRCQNIYDTAHSRGLL